jgi:hypothetical protein
VAARHSRRRRSSRAVEQLRACSEELGTLVAGDFNTEQPKSQRKPSEVRKPEGISVQLEPKIETPEEVEPAMGVSDLLDEALRDIEGAA